MSAAAKDIDHGVYQRRQVVSDLLAKGEHRSLSEESAADFERVLRFYYAIRDNVLCELSDIEADIIAIEAELYESTKAR